MNRNGSLPSAIYPADLALTTNIWVEQITTDIPFLAVGITALSAVTCLLVTQRLSLPALCILAATFFAFNGAIFDFAQLLQEAKAAPNGGATNTVAITVLREVNFSISTTLNFLFFLIFLGRPPRGELKLANASDRVRARRESPSRWGYWGIFGYVTLGALGASILAIAILEMIWRITNKPGGALYRADNIIQAVLCLVFLGKVLLNTYLSPLSPRWKTIRDYLPVILAVSTRLGIAITSEFCIGFTECSLGRLLTAVQLYVLIVFVLTSPYYGERAEGDKPASKRASSFRGLRFSNPGRWSVLTSAPIFTDANRSEKRLPTDLEAPRRPSPPERLSSWLNSKLVAPRRDPQEDRLWNKDQQDLEAPASPADRNPEDETSPIQARYFDQPPTATWQGPYIGTQNPTEASTNDATSPFSRADNGTNLTTPISAPPKAALATSNAPGTRPTSFIPPLGKFTGKFEVRQSFESGSDSPIYGINGIVKRQNSKRSRRSTYMANNESEALYQLQKEQAELEKSMVSMAAYSPSRDSFIIKDPTTIDAGFGRARFADSGKQATSSFLSAPSGSLKSDFSLKDFPSPPGSMFRVPRDDSPSPPNPDVDLPGNPPPLENMDKARNERPDTQVVEDVQFAMVPPRMPAAFAQQRRASFPFTRESAASSMDGTSRIISTYAESEDDIGGKRVRMSGVNNRLDVTSFIGELTTPAEVSRVFVPRRSNLGRRNESTDSRLSPLPEDNSPRPSVEIIDMRLKSTTFSPAIAITTGEKSPFSEVSRKVSFAPVTYDASSRPKLPLISVPLTNTLPSSPRPAASPIASPSRAAGFKPATSSPLATPASGSSPTSQSPTSMPRSKPTYPGYAKGVRPVITGPFPMGAGEGDKVTRRNPPQRF